ncbi:MAG TPA: ATP-binding protein [Verrucomicrobiae bacterium]|nr:ATP-binding protein [Verrucomicrobiae bacterium]
MKAISKIRFSFQLKVLLPVLTVMMLLMAVTIWLVDARISEQMHQNAASQLATADVIFKQLHLHQTATLLSKNRNALNEPRIKAVTQSADLPTIKHTLDEVMQEMLLDNEANVAVFTLLKQDEPQLVSSNANIELNVSNFQAKAMPTIARAAQGNAAVDTIRVGTNLLDIASFPVGTGDDIAGVLTFGLRIGSEQALETRQITRSQIVLIADGHVAASSIKDAGLFPVFIDRFNALTANDAAGPELMLNDEHYLCRAGHFSSLNGDKAMGYLLLSSYEDSWIALRATQQMLLAAGVLGIGISGVIVWLLLRRITWPLRHLRNCAEAVGRGDYSRRVEVFSRDECGELATAFNKMTQNVKNSRDELEKTVETLKSTQHQLIQSEKLSGIGEFVAGVAHELNNPLTSVMGFSELLQQSDLPEQQRRYLDVIFKSAKRCQKIVQSLLSFARRHAPERKVVCVNEIVESAIEILQYQMRTSNIEVVTQLDPHLPATELDPHQMQQVFLNIINNARQAMEGRPVAGRLRVSSEAVENYVRIIFQDNGPGIPPENLKRIFNPFFTTKEVGKGTGLGLSLCYGIISEHGGTITPYSTYGEGATFVVELPITHQLPQVAEKKAAPSANDNAEEGLGKRVLVVDDEDLILQMVREILTRNGYKVDIAHDGESALRRLTQYHYDLALCDWKMPGLSGQQIYERLHASNPEMSKRIIFITGDVVNEKVQEFLRARNKVCLSKPFTLVEFRSAIDQVLKAN